MKTVYSDQHRLHDPKVEFSGGRFVPGFEIPRRAEIVLARVQETKLGPVLAPAAAEPEAVARVHDPAFVEFLTTGHEEWRKVYGDSAAIPATWIGPAMRRKLPNRIGARFGYYCFDAATAMTATSWQAAKAGAAVAHSAQRLVAAGERAAFALCRPPGHHAGRDFYGGYCFLNNAAIAAQAFIDGGASRAAVLDVDFHHGNGTQEIFYRRSDSILFEAETIELIDRCYRTAQVRLSPAKLRIGEDDFNPEEVVHMEAITREISVPREAMGLGDVKFMAAIGAFLGWQGAIFALMASAIARSTEGSVSRTPPTVAA
jgi:acetoin utilization deacetylase AcuC-like enzyme